MKINKKNEKRDFQNEQENEKSPLNSSPIVKLYDSGIKSSNRRQFYYFAYYALLFCIFLLILDTIRYLLISPKTIINNKIEKNKNFLQITNSNKSNEINNIDNRITVGFLLPKLTSVILSNTEFLIKSEEFNVYFLTKSTNLNKIQYTKNITLINVFNKSNLNHEIIEKICKAKNIEFFIVNENIKPSEIKRLKSLGIKIIGYFDENIIVKHTHNWENFELYDLLIQNNIEDYNIYVNNNFTKNIFIPNIYEPLKTKLTNKNNYNIILIGKLNDKKNGITSVLNAINFVSKEFQDFKLNIISPDNKTTKLYKLILKLKLEKNIDFPLFSKDISSYFYNSSLLLYISPIEDIPDVINKAISYNIPCIISNKNIKNIYIKDGFIKLDISKEKELAKEIIKIFKDNHYRRKILLNAKSNLEKYNEGIKEIWKDLFISMKNGTKKLKRLKENIEKKFVS